MANVVVVGMQWGDEGKGKIVDLLCPAFDAVVRYQGGHNAGHTVKFGDRHFALRLIPSGILHPTMRCVMGNGMVVSPEAFFEELDQLQAAGVEIRGHRGPECRMRVRPLALKRILSNLVDNATRYGAGRPVDIEYAVAAGQVEICVLDRGPGLAIVRQIAGSNGWTVELRPRPGGGTAACVRLPLEEGVQAP